MAKEPQHPPVPVETQARRHRPAVIAIIIAIAAAGIAFFVLLLPNRPVEDTGAVVDTAPPAADTTTDATPAPPAPTAPAD